MFSVIALIAFAIGLLLKVDCLVDTFLDKVSNDSQVSILLFQVVVILFNLIFWIILFSLQYRDYKYCKKLKNHFKLNYNQMQNVGKGLLFFIFLLLYSILDLLVNVAVIVCVSIEKKCFLKYLSLCYANDGERIPYVYIHDDISSWCSFSCIW